MSVNSPPDYAYKGRNQNAGVGVNTTDDCTALPAAAWAEDVEEVQRLIDAGVDLDATDNCTALQASACAGNGEIVCVS